MAPGAIGQALRALPLGDDSHETSDVSDDPETARQIAELARDDTPVAGARRRRGRARIHPALLRLLDSAGARSQDRYVPASRQCGDARRQHGRRRRARHGADRRVLRRAGRVADGCRRCRRGARGLAEQAEIVHADGHAASAPGDPATPHLDTARPPLPAAHHRKAKGPAIRQLRGEHPRPVAFVDDIAAQSGFGPRRGRRCASLPPDGHRPARTAAAAAGRHRRGRGLARRGPKIASALGL